MENNNYTYKQILIGLRNEYLIVKNELDELNKYIVNNSQSEYEYRFRLGIPLKYGEDEKAKLMLDLTKRKRELFYRLKYIMQVFGIINMKPTSIKMIKYENGMYLPKKDINGNLDKRFKISILPGKEEDFVKRVDTLRDSEFAKFMHYSEEELTNFLLNSNAHIWCTSPNYSQKFSNKELTLKYIGLDDIIELGSVCQHGETFKPITNEMFQTALNTEISKNAFSDYHRRIIDSSLSSEKEIVFSEDYVPTIHSKFAIEDSKKALVLHKIK